MPRIVLTLTSPLFDEDQEVSIRENLPGRTLLSEIVKEYNLGEGNYSLRLKANNKVVDLDKTLEQSGVQAGAIVMFNVERRAPVRGPIAALDNNVRRSIAGTTAYLREESTGTSFQLYFTPSIIGRPDANNPTSVEALGVNLGHLEAAKSVSRNHARVLEQSGQYYLEAVAENNPTLLNDGVVRLGERRLLQTGDKITVGKINLLFVLGTAGEATDVMRSRGTQSN